VAAADVRLSKREVIRTVLRGEAPPYVPWSYRFTHEARETLQNHWGESWERRLDNHFVELGSDIGFFDDLGGNRFRDLFGVVWDRSVEKDIGLPESVVLDRPDLEGMEWPDPLDWRFYETIPEKIKADPDGFRVFCIGFSLYERAWSLRGIENLLVDFYENPDFVHALFERIVDFNVAQVEQACRYDIDAVYFGDDWGAHRGLIMGYDLWRRFLRPHLERMYGVVKNAGKSVVIHSCGAVGGVLSDLVDIGVDCFNPFQPEVMDIAAVLEAFRGRLAFWGGLSTQSTLPFGTPEEVRSETRRLIELGRHGGYILSPSHAVEGDVPLENILAFVEEAEQQIQ